MVRWGQRHFGPISVTGQAICNGGDGMLLDNIVIRTLTRLFDLILLNILWVICSLPVVTMGASTSALYSVMLKIAVNEEGYLIRGFLVDFKKNFKQSTVVWMILLIIGAALGADFMIIGKIKGIFGNAGMILLGAATLIYLIEIIFIFPIIARFENTTINVMKNALLIPLSRLPYIFPVLLLTAVCLLLTFLNQKTVVIGAAVWSVIGGALLVFANSFIMHEMFRPFEEKETTPQR